MEDLNQSAATNNKGSLIGTIIVVIVLIIGAIYLLSGRTTPENTGTFSTSTEEVGTTTTVDDLENAANQINPDSLNTEAAALDEAIGQ